MPLDEKFRLLTLIALIIATQFPVLAVWAIGRVISRIIASQTKVDMKKLVLDLKEAPPASDTNARVHVSYQTARRPQAAPLWVICVPIGFVGLGWLICAWYLTRYMRWRSVRKWNPQTPMAIAHHLSEPA